MSTSRHLHSRFWIEKAAHAHQILDSMVAFKSRMNDPSEAASKPQGRNRQLQRPDAPHLVLRVQTRKRASPVGCADHAGITRGSKIEGVSQ